MTLSAREWLDLWEAGSGQHALVQGVLLLGIMRSEVDTSGLLDVPLGDRNRQLLTLQRQWIGRKVESELVCPQCQVALEFAIEIEQLLAVEGASSGARITSRHLLGALGLSHAAAREQVALASGLDSASLASIGDNDPLAEIGFEPTCLECGHSWHVGLDPASFLWSAVERRAGAILGEVHTLARAYGWSEREILDLSPSRRHLYLTMVGGA